MGRKLEWVKGIFPPVVTPFREDKKINKKSYREILRFLLPHVNGIVTCGTTGEFVYLSGEEKLEILRITIDEVKGKCPVIMGTACPSTRQTVQFTEEVKKMGADAVLVAAPYFIHPSFNEVYEHFEAINEVGIPIILYNIPQCTGTHFRWWTAEAVAKFDNVVAIKDTSGDMPFLEAMLEKVGGEISILVGHDEIVAAAFAAGADGAILTSSNVIPDIWQEIYRASKTGNLKKARNLQAQIQKFVRIITRTCAVQAAKESLQMMGFDVGNARLPIMRGGGFKREDYEEVRNYLTSVGIIPLKAIEFDLGNGKKFKTKYPAVPETPSRISGFTLKSGEAFSGPPLTEVAHIDLLIGIKGGPVDNAVQKALMRPPSKSKPRIIGNLPKILLVPTVTISNEKQESHVFEDAKEGVLLAVDGSITAGELPEEILDDIVIVANVFVHPGASMRFRIKMNNYKAMRAAIRRALESRPTLDELKADMEAFRHPLKYAL